MYKPCHQAIHKRRRSSPNPLTQVCVKGKERTPTTSPCLIQLTYGARTLLCRSTFLRSPPSMKKMRPCPSELETKIPALHGVLTKIPPTGPFADLFHTMLRSEARTAKTYLAALDQEIASRRKCLIASMNPPEEDHQPELMEFDRSAGQVRQAVENVLSGLIIE